MNLLRKLVNGHIRGRTDQDLAGIHLCKVVDDGGRGDRLACSRRTLLCSRAMSDQRGDDFRCITDLNQAQRLL